MRNIIESAISKNSSNIYLDYNAMSLVRPEIIDNAQQIFSLYGNPFASHSHGRESKKILEQCKENIAHYINCKPTEVYFTSGATESNNIAIYGLRNSVDQYIFGSTEHESVTNLIPNHQTVTVRNGLIDLIELGNILKNTKSAFVSIIFANNETGIITQNLKEAIDLTHKYGGIFHSDAVQAIGKMKISFHDLDIDLLSISSLKLGGFMGAGALIKHERIKNCLPIMSGRIDNSLKPGTPAIHLIISLEMSLAIAEKNRPEEQKKYENMRNYLESSIKQNGGQILGEDTQRVANTTYAIMPLIDQSEQVMLFDMNGISVSAGSSCYKTRFFSEKFIESTGVAKETYQRGVRFSMGFGTTMDEIKKTAEMWNKIKNCSGQTDII